MRRRDHDTRRDFLALRIFRSVMSWNVVTLGSPRSTGCCGMQKWTRSGRSSRICRARPTCSAREKNGADEPTARKRADGGDHSARRSAGSTRV